MANDYSGKYLDGNGVSHLWAKIKATFALISHTHGIGDVTNLQTSLDGKQDTLVSGTNIKTVGSQSLLGSGNLTPANIGAAPTSHKSTGMTYGAGDASNYGHVKLSDATNGTAAAASGGTAATPKAVADALAAAKTYADTTYSDFTGASSSAAGTHGLVPAPGAGEQYSVLLGNADFVALPEAIQLAADDDAGFVYVVDNETIGLIDDGTLMTAAEKTKLAGIAAGAQVNSITGVKGNSETSYRTGNVNLTAANIGAAASSHAHGNITSGGDITATAPTVASGDKLVINDESASKITNGPAFGTDTTKYLRNDGTWGTPAGTTYSDFTGATASAAGAHGLVPAPASGDTKRTLFGDGGWSGYALGMILDSQSDTVELVLYKGTQSTSNALASTSLGAATARDVDTSIASGSTSTNLPTSAAVASAISAAMSDVAGALVYKGTVGTGGTVTDLPANHTKGWYYVVKTAGTYAGKTCEVGDMLICNTTGTTANNAHWDAVQSNITALTTTEIDAIVAAA